MGERKQGTVKKSGGEKQVTITLKLKDIILIAAIALAVIFCVLWLNARSEPVSEGTEPAQQEQQTEATQAELTEEDMDVSGVSLSGKRIIIDAGHGAPDVGSIAASSGVEEKDINLAIAQKLKGILEAEGVTVIMTREGDDALNADKELDFQAREKIILESNPDMFVSIHQNEFTDNAEASGPQVFYVAQGSVGKRLAVAIQDMLNYKLDPAEPRIPLDVAYRLLKTGTQPSCIVECGFLSNPDEEAKLVSEEYQQEMAQMVTDGIKLYVKRFD